MLRTAHSSWIKWLLVALAGWFVVLTLRLISLGGEWQPVSLLTWATVSTWLFLYVAGFAAGAASSRAPRASSRLPDVLWFRKWIVLLSIIAAFGAAAIIYEFAIVRGYGFITDVASIRISEVNNSRDGFGGSWISGLGRLMTPALVPAWLLALISVEKIGKKTWSALLVGTSVVLYQQSTFEGGRFFLSALILSCLIALNLRAGLARKFGTRRTARSGGGKRILIALFAVTLAAVFFGSIFVSRVALTYPDLAAAYETFSSRFPLYVSSEKMERLQNDNSLWFVVYMFWIYATHAINQLDVLLQHENLVRSMGILEFAQISKAISILTGYNLSYDLFANLPIAGTYITFLGPAYIDFGLPITFLMGLGLGVITGSAFVKLNRGRFSGFGLATPIFVALGVFSPIHSLVLNLWPAIFWAYIAARKSAKVRASAPDPVTINETRSLNTNV